MKELPHILAQPEPCGGKGWKFDKLFFWWVMWKFKKTNIFWIDFTNHRPLLPLSEEFKGFSPSKPEVRAHSFTWIRLGTIETGSKVNSFCISVGNCYLFYCGSTLCRAAKKEPPFRDEVFRGKDWRQTARHSLAGWLSVCQCTLRKLWRILPPRRVGAVLSLLSHWKWEKDDLNNTMVFHLAVCLFVCDVIIFFPRRNFTDEIFLSF